VIETPAIVLHAFDYRETSRIVRLATRDVGVVSVIARGARRPKSRFGTGLDLFTSGIAQIAHQGTRDLHTLASFDATHARQQLAGSMRRFTAAAALAELCLRFGAEATAGLHDALRAGLDALGDAPDARVADDTLAAGWRIVAELGFAPVLDACALCHRSIADEETVRFAHRAGGGVCGTCRPLVPGARPIPPDARATIRTWVGGDAAAIPDVPTARAHQRLLREFLEEHLADGRPMRAFHAWVEMDA
jgi:DNA repair protein RecO (recombination protein O)